MILETNSSLSSFNEMDSDTDTSCWSEKTNPSPPPSPVVDDKPPVFVRVVKDKIERITKQEYEKYWNTEGIKKSSTFFYFRRSKEAMKLCLAGSPEWRKGHDARIRKDAERMTAMSKEPSLYVSREKFQKAIDKAERLGPQSDGVFLIIDEEKSENGPKNGLKKSFWRTLFCLA